MREVGIDITSDRRRLNVAPGRIWHSLGVSDDRQTARLVDYERTVATIHQLTEVRFKLAAFLPALTGAAVALLAASELGPLTTATLGFGGLCFSLGIVLYDLRNSQHYNSAIGRATELEKVLGFDVFAPDRHPGVFGSRRDTTSNVKADGRDHFVGLSVRHGTALALVYTAVIGAWIWVVLRAAADGFADGASDSWLRVEPHGQWVALGVTTLLTVLVFRGYRRHDPPPSDAKSGKSAPK